MSNQIKALRIGFGAAVFNTAGGIAYLVILGIIIATATPMTDPGAPALVAVSSLTLIGPLGLIPLWAAVHLSTSADKQVLSLISLIFVILFSVTTSINRWVHLTVVRQAIAEDITQGLEWFTPYGEHSIMYALEILAYGWFLGFALLAIAYVFERKTSQLERGLFWACLISGILCLGGGMGELLGIESFVLMITSITGWGLGLGLINVLLSIWFYQQSRFGQS